MIDMTALKQIFAEKLLKTDSFDEALKKVCWVAYQSKSGWISVEDKHPERVEGERILAYLNGSIFECEFDDGVWGNVYGNEFTHWMPLPEPPKASD